MLWKNDLGEFYKILWRKSLAITYQYLKTYLTNQDETSYNNSVIVLKK